MLIIVGTVPDPNLGLLIGKSALKSRCLTVEKTDIPIQRGTPALIASACKVCEVFGAEQPLAILAGDIGLGHGSRELYAYLTEHIREYLFSTIVFHYLQPDVDWHCRVLFALQEMQQQPTLIADAGFMYAAKMSGYAGEYDLFTPDIGELAFLADENAPHPFYTRGFILHEQNKVQDLISRAYQHKNAARNLLIKGATDLIVSGGEIIKQVNEPVVEALEAMGGTGDTVTGMTAALISSGLGITEACTLAARTNRLAGKLANPTPASQVTDIIEQIPTALRIKNRQDT